MSEIINCLCLTPHFGFVYRNVCEISLTPPLQDSEREDLNISPSRGDTSNDVKKLESKQLKESPAKKNQNKLGSNAGATPEDGDVRFIFLSFSVSLSLSL